MFEWLCAKNVGVLIIASLDNKNPYRKLLPGDYAMV